MNDYQQFIHKSRYAKWDEENTRRETWDETVDRYVNYWKNRFPEFSCDWKSITNAIHSHDVMPSMRCMMVAGPALDRDNVAGYNCSYLAIDRIAAFSEVMYILMCGTGVGFSVERKYVDELPRVAEEFHHSDTKIVVADSRIGWARSFKELLGLLYSGQIPYYDLSNIRPKGERLKTFGGRASGPEPLDDLFKYCIQLFRNAAGRKLNNLEVHDLVCKIAEIVVVGGVRRSALISLSNLSDRRIADCKLGNWYDAVPHRALSNNSACYTDKPDVGAFLIEWKNLIDSKAGERGIFNRMGVKKNMEEIAPRRNSDYDFGTNPCSEIILRDRQFCNLTEVIIRSDDTLNTLKRKVEIASLLGTLQSTLTDFRFLSKPWKSNCDEERLLGVSLSGWMDHKILSNQKHPEFKKWLNTLRDHAIAINKKYAEALNIPQSTSVTCVKPSGTVSQLVDCASGIHPRYSDYYIRRVRMSDRDPLCDFMMKQGVPWEKDNWAAETIVFSFPMKAPTGCVSRNDRTAIEQLEHWLAVSREWCEHKPSITVYVRDSEWLEVAAFVYKNFDYMSGVSFLPHSDHIYTQAPYEEIDRKTYRDMNKGFPTIAWDDFSEVIDNTTSSHELACTGGVCEL